MTSVVAARRVSPGLSAGTLWSAVLTRPRRWEIEPLSPISVIWLYRLIYLPVFLILLPHYAWRMWKRGGYARFFAHRFGRLPRLPPPAPGVTRLWIQAVSVGELQAVEPLLRSLHQRPGVEVVLTTTTSTGLAVLQNRLADLTVAYGIFPLDFWLFSACAWRRLKPGLAVLLEGELWPEHLEQARRRQAPVLLLNARLSDRSYRRYQFLPGLSRLIFRRLRLILAGTPQDAGRLAAFTEPGVVRLAGNLKFDVEVAPLLAPPEIAALREELGLAADPGEQTPYVMAGASTWPGEEEALLAACQAAEAAGLAVRLLLIPRHVERREELRAWLAGTGGRFHFRSDAPRAARPVAVSVADTTGEMRRLLQVADLVFVGKSLPPHAEGQSPIDAAALGKPILHGPGMSNFREAARTLDAAGAARLVNGPDSLTAAVIDLLRDSRRRATMSAAARQWHAGNRGALAKSLQAIDEVLSARRVG